MNLYARLGAAAGTPEAATLSDRLASWHDAMVAHERRLRAPHTGDSCDDECPHAEARELWPLAQTTFGADARELAFLRSRARAASDTVTGLPSAATRPRPAPGAGAAAGAS